MHIFNSGQWKGIFWLVETLFFKQLLDISASDSFSSSSRNVVLKRILHSGQWEPIFFTFLVKAFSVQCKIIFQQIFYSGQWKLIFCVVETILFQYLKHTFHWRQFFHLLEIYFKQILQPVATDFQFSGNDILSFTFVQMPSSQLEGGQYLKKYILFLLGETVFFLFFQILIRMEVAFRSNEIAFFKESFILASGNGFRSITNFVLLFGFFFCWWTQFLKLGVNQFIKFFLFLTAEAVFPANGNGFFIEYFIPASGNGFYAQSSYFVLVETIIQIKMKPFFIKKPPSHYWKPFITVFLDIPAGESSFSAQQKRIFLTNPSFWLVESEFLSIENSILLFTAFFLSVETIISSKIRFHQPKTRISLKNTFPLHRKKLARSQINRKKWFPLARKSVVH